MSLHTWCCQGRNKAWNVYRKTAVSLYLSILRQDGKNGITLESGFGKKENQECCLAMISRHFGGQATPTTGHFKIWTDVSCLLPRGRQTPLFQGPAGGAGGPNIPGLLWKPPTYGHFQRQQ